MSKTYYAQVNAYGSETDIGFANTWSVLAFDSASLRDAWVLSMGCRLDVQAITAAEAAKMAGTTTDYGRSPRRIAATRWVRAADGSFEPACS